MIDFYKKESISGSSKNIEIGWMNRNDWADPFKFTSKDIEEYYHIQSEGFGGIYSDVEAGELNFPINNPIRLFVQFPMNIDSANKLIKERKEKMKLNKKKYKDISFYEK